MSESRRVLLITFHFPPYAASGSFRMLGFAQHLPALGWNVSVVSCSNYPYEPLDPGLSTRVPSGVTVYEIDYPQFTGWRLLLSRLARRAGIWYEGRNWLKKVWPVIAKLIREQAPDVILTSGPPHLAHVLGRRAKRFFRVAWVADFRDPWVAGQWKQYSTSIRERRAERSIVTEADLVIANAPRAREAFHQHYPKWSHKFITLTNGYDPAPLPVHLPRGDRPIRIAHIGELYVGRDPRPLFDAIAVASSDVERIYLDFIGRVEGISIEAEAERRGLAGVIRATGHLSCVEANRVAPNADVLLLMDTPGRCVGVPAKLYEYIGSGRPILALAERESDTAWVLKESGIPHALASPRDVSAIAAAITEVIALASISIRELPVKAARYTRANLAAELSGHFTRLLKKPHDVSSMSVSRATERAAKRFVVAE